jgi:DNA polymerase III subunit beta
MRFVVDRNTLVRALGHVTGIVERRHTIPILGNVLIRSLSGEALSLKASDLDMEALETLPATVEQQGSVTAPAHTLHDIVRKLPEGADIRFEYKSETGRLTLSAGRASFELQVLPAEDFPDMGDAELPHKFTIPSHELKRLFEKPRFAMSTEETRYYLNGIFLHTIAKDGASKLRAVATDGHRLAQAEVESPGGLEGALGVIVPRKAVGEVLKLLGDEKGDAAVALSPSKIRFQVGDVVLTSKLVDGSFPDYGRVIPTSNKKILKLDNALLVKAVDRVSTLSSDKGKAVKLNISSGKLTISLNNPDAGSATEEIEAEFDGEPFEIGFNARYLLDITGQIDGDRIELKLADPASPTLFSDEADRSALYVLMPMRV